MNHKLCVSVRELKAGGIRVSPKERMSQSVTIKRNGGLKVAHSQQKVINLAKEGFCHAALAGGIRNRRINPNRRTGLS